MKNLRSPLSILTEPPLTSVTAHLEVMGEMAVKMLLDRLDDPQHLPYKIVLPPTPGCQRQCRGYTG